VRRVAVTGVSETPSIYRDWWIDERNRLEPVGSLNALLASDGGAYFKTGSTIHLKLVSQDGRELDRPGHLLVGGLLSQFGPDLH